MVEINLLSWRAEKQAYELKSVRQTIAASVAAACIILIALHILLSEKVRRDALQLQRMHIAAPQEMHVAERDTQEILSAQLLALLLDAAAKISGSGVCYQRIARDDNGWRLEGQALSLQSVSSGLTVFMDSALFAKMNLQELKKAPGHDYFQFVMRLPAAAVHRGV